MTASRENMGLVWSACTRDNPVMGELGEEHGREVAQDAERAGLGIHARLAGVPVAHSARNEVENLLENDYIAADWCW